MKLTVSIFCLFLFLGIFSPAYAAGEKVPPVRVLGAVSVALPLTEAIDPLKKEYNISILMRAEPSGTALEALGERFVNIALSSREVSAVDRAASPQTHFMETPIGVQLIAMVVSRDVWEGGVHALSASQARDIYEGKITNWKEVGGPDQKIQFFMSVPGKGLWEIFVQWLYGEQKKAPKWEKDTAKEYKDTVNFLEFNLGSLGLVPPSYANNKTVYSLAFHSESGALIEPTLENVLKEKYPLSRPLLMVTDDRPTGQVKTVIDFMTGERGQALVKKCGYITLIELEQAKTMQ